MNLHRSRSAFSLLAFAACIAGCSGGGGFLGTIALPKGNIGFASSPGGTVLNTSATSPYVVDDGFSIAISETNYSGPYTITMYSWSNGFNEPCFVPHTASATIYSFEPDNAAAATAPKGTPNPCQAGDVETALVNDGKGHTAYFSFELGKALTGGSVPTPTPVPTGSAGATGCAQGDPNGTEVAITGALQQFPFPPCNDFTMQATLPANTGAGDDLTLATSEATQFGDSLTTANGLPLIAIAFQPSPESFSFSDATSLFTVIMKSPSKLGGGTYTMELRENNAVIQTIPGISPSGDTITFNMRPTDGAIDLAEYVAIIYKN